MGVCGPSRRAARSGTEAGQARAKRLERRACSGSGRGTENAPNCAWRTRPGKRTTHWQRQYGRCAPDAGFPEASNPVQVETGAGAGSDTGAAAPRHAVAVGCVAGPGAHVSRRALAAPRVPQGAGVVSGVPARAGSAANNPRVRASVAAEHDLPRGDERVSSRVGSRLV